MVKDFFIKLAKGIGNAVIMVVLYISAIVLLFGVPAAAVAFGAGWALQYV